MAKDLRGNEMRKTVIVSLAFVLILSLINSVALAANFFEEGLQIIDNQYQDETFGGDSQTQLIISFIPGDDLTHDADEANGVDGDWFIIIDADDDGDFNDDTIIASGNASSDTAVTYNLNRNTIAGMPDGEYELAAIIDNIANGQLDWEGETSTESLDFLFRIDDEYQITLVDFIRDLDERTVSAGLRQEFLANAITLSVTSAPSGSWTITDGDTVYTVTAGDYDGEGDDDDLRVTYDDGAATFDIEDPSPSVIDNLNRGAVSGELWASFIADGGVTFSVWVDLIAVITPGQFWMLTDRTDVYNIVMVDADADGDKDDLRVYGAGFFEIIDVSQDIIDALDNRYLIRELWEGFRDSFIDIAFPFSEDDDKRVTWVIHDIGGIRDYVFVVKFDDTGENEQSDDHTDHDELEVYSENVLLFVIRTGLGHNSDLLDMDIIPQDLRNEFANREIPLSLNATVSVRDYGNEWEIKGSSYVVKKENGDKLAVYEADSSTSSNDADIDEEEFTLDRNLEITEVDVDPDRFSPNGDSVRDTTTVYYTLSESLYGSNEDVVITIGEGQLTSPAKPIPGTRSGRNGVIWDGRDGLGNFVEDGTYTIKIEATDSAGNEATATIQVEATTGMPEVSVTTPAEDTSVSSLIQVSARLQDNSGEGIDLTKSLIWLESPSGTKLPGEQSNDGVNEVRYRLTNALPGDGSADGEYTIVVRAVDEIGNTEDTQYTFFYDSVFPTVVSVMPPDGSILTIPPTEVVVVLEDGTGSGPDLAATAQTINISGIPGSAVHNGIDTITFTAFDEVEPGEYTVQIIPTDFAGNRPSQALTYEFTVVEDITDIFPEIVSTSPGERDFVNSINTVSASLLDNSGEGIDLELSTISLTGPTGAVAGAQTDDGNNTITLELTGSLPTDGSADGTYTIAIEAVDKAGRKTEESMAFVYDTQVPEITSISPADESVLTEAPSQIVITVTDGAGSGVDFASSKSSLSVSGISNIIREDNGVDTMTFSFDAPEDTGEYIVTVRLSDGAGNEHTYQSQFDYVDEPANVLPEVASIEPTERASINSLTQVSADLTDNSGKGIDFTLSTISLTNPAGVAVAGVQTDDDNDTIALELTSPLPTDGSADGTYIINVDMVDETGGTNTYTSTFVYDTQVPSIVSIIPADESVLTEAPDQVVIVVSDGTGSGVNFADSKNSLGINGISNIIREDNGVDTMTFSFDAPEDTGEYTITVILSDDAGNEHTYQSQFEYVEEVTNVLPEVASVEPAERASINSLMQVSADLIDNSEKGIDLDLSTISLTNPDGVAVAGVQTDDENDTITLELTSPLPTDGSADGPYTISVSAIDKTGGTNTYTSTFVYDTQVPTMVSITPADESVLTEAPAQVVIVVSDDSGSGVDFANSKSSLNISGISNIIREDNGIDTMTFSFDAPEDTGEYTITVTLSDDAGNGHTYQSQFEYVEEVTNVLPEVASVEPVERASINSVMQVSADLIDNSEKGIDLDLSTISLTNPDGVAVAGVQTDDENDTIVLELTSPLPTDGSADGTYTITVNAVDKAAGTTAYTSTFIYDTQVPTIISIAPADGSVLTEAPDQVVVVVNDGVGSGVNFAASKNSLSINGISNIVREDNGVDTMVFSFAAIEDTATYTVSITLSDNAGNEQTYLSEFDFVEEPEDLLPEVVSVDPDERASVNSLFRVSATIQDNSGEGIDLDLSTIGLTNADGTAIGGIQTDNNSDTITLELVSPLPTDGTADGTYTITVNAVDKVTGTTAYTSTFVYDTQVPTIVSIAPADGSVLTEAPSQVVVVVSDGDGSGVNFADSKASISLGSVSNIVKEDNGVDTMIFSFAALENTGKYTLTITVSDDAGNEQTYQSIFDFVEETTDLLPEVASVVPEERAFINSLVQVSSNLIDNSGKGIDLKLSTIILKNSTGAVISGVQTDDDNDTITMTLTRPRPTDGSADGAYTVEINAVDKAGGTTVHSSPFLFDSLSPSVVATTPAANDVFYEGISEVTVQFADGAGSGVDMEQTDVVLRGPNGVVEVDKSDNGIEIITLSFSKLTDNGNYTIEISPKDRAGNAGYPVEIKFSYVLKAPAVASVSLTNRAYVSSLESIEAVLEDRSGIGLDLSETGSSIVVVGPGGEIQADQSNNDVDTIVWSPVHLLASDGTDDGTYTVTITPMDTTGTTGQSRIYEVVYDTQPPEVRSASPVDINADITHVGSQLTAVQALISDEGPAGIEIEEQGISLEAEDGTQIAGVQTNDGTDTVIWNLDSPLAKDGTADGIYTVVVNAVDRGGAEQEFRYPLVYDTSRPQISVLSPANKALLGTNISEVSAKLSDSNGGEIDFQQSRIDLLTPSGSSVTGAMSNNGVDSMSLEFEKLEENGTYTMQVTAVDKAGNGAGTPWKSEFVFETGLPVVLSTVPATTSPDEAYTRAQIRTVQVRLLETDNGGIDLSSTGSKVRLQGPDGEFIIGTQTDNNSNTIIFSLGRARLVDGTEDGEYTILVTAVNAAGRRDAERAFKFIYDTQIPEIASVSHLNVNAALSYVSNQITELEIRLQDKGPAGIDIDRSSARLIDPAGKNVDADYSDDDNNMMKLEFPNGLSAEGTYTLSVTAMDETGGANQKDIKFIYSVSIPEVVATVPATTPADAAYTNSMVKDVRAELRETGSSGIDLSPTGSTIRLIGPKGNVPGVQSNDDSILIFALTDSLAIDGSDDGEYTIVVTPVNAAKLKGGAVDFKFMYDTVAPEVDKDNIQLWFPSEGDSSLSEISAIVTDDQPGSGIDWENFDNNWMKLQDSTGEEIVGEVSVNAEESKVILTLDVPLSSSGSQDGFYTVVVAPTDKSGNEPKPSILHEFLYDTRPPMVNKAEITINDKVLLLDSDLDEYPTAINTKNGVTITAMMEDDGIGADLTQSSIKVIGPGGEVTGSLSQDGVNTIWFTSGLLNAEGTYSVEINPVDLDGNGLSNSSETISTQFLFEEGKPTAQLTEPAIAEEEAEDEPIELKGTAVDEPSGEGIPASGVAKVEIGGIGPGGVELEWITAEDDSDADEEAWSEWSLDFLPDASGTYEIEIRVWDEAGNFEIYDADLKLEFTVSLAFQGGAYCWPNPVTEGVAHISFEINAPDSQNTTVKLLIYDVSGDLIYEEEHMDISSRTRTSVEWDCTNAAGEKVVTGIYIFRLESELDDQVANKVGKPMIIKN